MDIELTELEKKVEIIKTILEILILSGGIIFAIFRFLLKKEFNPKIQFNVDLKIIDKTDKCWLIEIIALIENKGNVRHKIDVKNYTFSLRYLTSDSLLNNGYKLKKENTQNNEEFFSLNIDKKLMDHLKNTDFQMLPNYFESTYIDPGVAQKYSQPLSIPLEAKYILISSKFYNRSVILNDFYTAQGFFKLEIPINKKQ